MKIVKEHINEIKRGTGSSGLSSIGVGNAAMFKAFDVLKKNWPGVMWILEKPREDDGLVLKKEFEESAKLFGVPKNMVRYISTVNAPKDDRKKFIDTFMSMKKDPNVIKNNYTIKSEQATRKVKSSTSLEWGITVVQSTYNARHTYVENTTFIFKMPEDIEYKE